MEYALDHVNADIYRENLWRGLISVVMIIVLSMFSLNRKTDGGAQNLINILSFHYFSRQIHMLECKERLCLCKSG